MPLDSWIILYWKKQKNIIIPYSRIDVLRSATIVIEPCLIAFLWPNLIEFPPKLGMYVELSIILYLK